MRVKTLLATAGVIAGLMVGAPAFAQTGGDVTTDNDSDRNDIYNDLIDVFWTDNAADSYTKTYSSADQDNDQDNDENGSYNGNNVITATQVLSGVNNNQYMDELVDLDGEDDSETAVGYNSGNNSVNDSAFAAYAGILNQAWNTGINANTQAATNIAAQGTVNFGEAGGGGGGGAGED